MATQPKFSKFYCVKTRVTREKTTNMKSKEGMQYKCNTNIARKENGSLKMKRLFNLLLK